MSLHYLKVVDHQLLKHFPLDPDITIHVFDETASSISSSIADEYLDITVVQERWLCASFSKNVGNFRHSWITLGSAIRVAQALGLDKRAATPRRRRQQSPIDDNEGEGDDDDDEIELVKTLWWALRCWDVFCSLCCGLSPTLNNKIFKVSGPAEPIDIPYAPSRHENTGTSYQQKEESLINMFGYEAVKLTLIASWFDLIDDDNCSKLIPELEQKLYLYENAMPRLYSVKDTDYSLDHEFTFLNVHRLLIQLYTNVMLVLAI